MSQLIQAYQETEKKQESYQFSLEQVIYGAAVSWIDEALTRIHCPFTQYSKRIALEKAEEIGYCLLQFLSENGLLELSGIDFEDSLFPFLNNDKILACWDEAKLYEEYEIEKPTGLVSEIADFLLKHERTYHNMVDQGKAFPSVELNSLLITSSGKFIEAVNFKEKISL